MCIALIQRCFSLSSFILVICTCLGVDYALGQANPRTLSVLPTGTTHGAFTRLTYTWDPAHFGALSHVWVTLIADNEPHVQLNCYHGYGVVLVQGTEVLHRQIPNNGSNAWIVTNLNYDSSKDYYLQVAAVEREQSFVCNSATGVMATKYYTSEGLALTVASDGTSFQWPPTQLSGTLEVLLEHTYNVMASGLDMHPDALYWALIVDGSINGFTDCSTTTRCWTQRPCSLASDQQSWLYNADIISTNNSLWHSWTLPADDRACFVPTPSPTTEEPLPQQVQFLMFFVWL